VDNDIKDALLASTFNAWLYDRFGRAPFRHRGNSHSRLMLFRAAEGEPRKASCKNKATGNGVEILGRGNQFFSYGIHPSGAELQWIEGPLETPRDQLPMLTDEQCQEIIEYAAQLIDADRKAFRAVNEPMPVREPTGDEWCIGDIKAALDAIPNVDAIGSFGSRSRQQCSTPAMVHRMALTHLWRGHARRDRAAIAQTGCGTDCVPTRPTQSRQAL
jgi:hypothetical protein